MTSELMFDMHPEPIEKAPLRNVAPEIGPDPFAVHNAPNRAYQQPPPIFKAEPIPERAFRYSPQAQQVYEPTPDLGFNPDPAAPAITYAAPAQPPLLMSADLSEKNAEVN